MNSSFDSLFTSACEHARQAAVLQSVADTLEWDERTGMPLGGSEYRATQVSTLRGMIHERLTDATYGEQLQRLADDITATSYASDPHGDVASTIRGLLRDYDRNRRLPVELVRCLSEATVRGQQLWDAARKADNFAAFAPALEQIVVLKREAGTLLSAGGDPYQALIEDYEPGADVQSLKAVFESLRGPLVDLVARLNAAPRQPDVSVLQRKFSIEGQRQLSRLVASAIGFDFNRGRLDETSHPFCTNRA